MNTYDTSKLSSLNYVFFAMLALAPALFATPKTKAVKASVEQSATLSGFIRDISPWKKAGALYEKDLSLYLRKNDKKATLVILKSKSRLDDVSFKENVWMSFKGEYVFNKTLPKNSVYSGTLIVKNFKETREIQEASLDHLKHKANLFSNKSVQVFGCVTEQENPTYSLKAKKHSWKTSFKLSKTCGMNEPSILVLAQGNTPQSLSNLFVDKGEWKTMTGTFKTSNVVSKNDVGTLEYQAD